MNCGLIHVSFFFVQIKFDGYGISFLKTYILRMIYFDKKTPAMIYFNTLS